jgi:uncharacterized membrane protein
MAMTEEKKKALWKRISSPAFWLAMLGAAKLVTDAFGIKFDDAQINSASNGLATICAMVGITLGYNEE